MRGKGNEIKADYVNCSKSFVPYCRGNSSDVTQKITAVFGHITQHIKKICGPGDEKKVYHANSARTHVSYRVVYKSQQPAKFAGFSARFHRLLSLLHESRYVEETGYLHLKENTA